MRKHVHFFKNQNTRTQLTIQQLHNYVVLNQLIRIFESKIGASGIVFQYLLKYLSHSESKTILH